jgi:hypothetical protein
MRGAGDADVRWRGVATGGVGDRRNAASTAVSHDVEVVTDLVGALLLGNIRAVTDDVRARASPRMMVVTMSDLSYPGVVVADLSLAESVP